MLALCLMLLGTYYAQNYASIIGGCLVARVPLQHQCITNVSIYSNRTLTVFVWFIMGIHSNNFNNLTHEYIMGNSGLVPKYNNNNYSWPSYNLSSSYTSGVFI